MRPALVFTLAMWFVVGLGKFMFIFSLLAIMGHGSAHQSADQLLHGGRPSYQPAWPSSPLP